MRGADVFVVQPTCPPVHDNLFELISFADCLRRASADRNSHAHASSDCMPITIGKGVDKFEFVIGMLVRLEIVRWSDVYPFVAQARPAAHEALITVGSVLTSHGVCPFLDAQALLRTNYHPRTP